MSTYTVVDSDGEPQTVTADSYEVEDGHLHLRRGDALVGSYAPRTWLTVSLLEEK